MKVGLVALNYNDFENTQKYVKLVSRYACINKIVIVDNCSTNIEKSAYDSLLSDKVDVIFSKKNAGFAAGNNYGIRYLNDTYGEFDYIIISNSDVFIEEKSIISCLNLLESDKKIAIAAPRMYYSENTPAKKSSWKSRKITDDMIVLLKPLKLIFYNKYKKSFYTEKEFSENEIMEVDCIAGSFFVARNSAFKEAGYFDENTFLYYEEDILSKKLKEKGYKTVSLNNEKFIHYESQTINKAFKIKEKQRLIFESMLYYHKKYNNANKWIVLFFNILFVLQKIELFIFIDVASLFKAKK